jgi:hypothetical protein
MVVLVLGLRLLDAQRREHAMLPTLNTRARTLEMSYIPSALRDLGWHMRATVWLEADATGEEATTDGDAAAAFRASAPLVKVRHVALAAAAGAPTPPLGTPSTSPSPPPSPPLYTPLECSSGFEAVEGMLGGGFWRADTPLVQLPAHGIIAVCAGMLLGECPATGAPIRMLAFSGSIALDAHADPTGVLVLYREPALPRVDAARLAELPVCETQVLGPETRLLWFEGAEAALAAVSALTLYLHKNYGLSPGQELPPFSIALLPATPVFDRFMPDSWMRPVRCASFCNQVFKRPFAFDDASHDLSRWDAFPDVS